MAEIEFIYNANKTTIQCNTYDKTKDIINKFLIKCNKKPNTLYFLYNGKEINEDLTFIEIANQIDKKRNKISVIVNDIISENQLATNLPKSKYIICPICCENIRISINTDKITLYDCKNGHSKNNLLFDEFEKTQLIDQTKIKCGVCKQNKSETFQNKFFICSSCKINLCPLCKSSHDLSHNIFDYEKKNFICFEHNEAYTSYCKKCHKDICQLCEKDHFYHEAISYGKILPDINKLKEELNKLKEKIDYFKNNIERLISNIENHYKLYNDMINHFDIKERNYPIIQNINDMNIFIKDFIKQKNDIFFNKINDLIESERKKEKEKIQEEEFIKKVYNNIFIDDKDKYNKDYFRKIYKMVESEGLVQEEVIGMVNELEEEFNLSSVIDLDNIIDKIIEVKCNKEKMWEWIEQML